MSTTSTVTIHQNPFYAGFGNRPTDTKATRPSEYPRHESFNQPSRRLETGQIDFYTPYSASSYSKLTEEVDKVFPPVRSPSSLTRVAGDEAFTDFQYWHGLGGGDVRMDLVQMALGGLKRKVDALIDENGKPVSPRQIGFEGSVSNSSSNTTFIINPANIPVQLRCSCRHRANRLQLHPPCRHAANPQEVEIMPMMLIPKKKKSLMEMKKRNW